MQDTERSSTRWEKLTRKMQSWFEVLRLLALPTAISSLLLSGMLFLCNSTAQAEDPQPTDHIVGSSLQSPEIWNGRVVTEGAEFVGILRMTFYELDADGNRTGRVETQDGCTMPFAQEIMLAVAHCIKLELLSLLPAFNNPAIKYPFEYFEVTLSTRGGDHTFSEMDKEAPLADFFVAWDRLTADGTKPVPMDLVALQPTQQGQEVINNSPDITALPIVDGPITSGTPAETFGFGATDTPDKAGKVNTTGAIPMYPSNDDDNCRIAYTTLACIGGPTIVTDTASAARGDSNGPIVITTTVDGKLQKKLAALVVGGIAEGTQPFFGTDLSNPDVQAFIQEEILAATQSPAPIEQKPLRFPEFSITQASTQIEADWKLGEAGVQVAVQGTIHKIMDSYSLLGRRALITVTVPTSNSCIIDVRYQPTATDQGVLLTETEIQDVYTAVVQVARQALAQVALGNITLIHDHSSPECTSGIPGGFDKTLTENVAIEAKLYADLTTADGRGGKPFVSENSAAQEVTVTTLNRYWLPVDVSLFSINGKVIFIYSSTNGTISGKRQGRDLIFAGTGPLGQDAVLTIDGQTPIQMNAGAAQVSNVFPDTGKYEFYIPLVAR